MSDIIEMDKVQQALDSGMGKAKELIDNPDQLTQVLADVQVRLKEVPVIGTVVKDLPTMISLVKSYATKEYTEVSPKVIASAVSALLYLLTKKDLINDKIPVIGLLDDMAVAALALTICKPELDAFTAWKTTKAAEPAPAPEAEKEVPFKAE